MKKPSGLLIYIAVILALAVILNGKNLVNAATSIFPKTEKKDTFETIPFETKEELSDDYPIGFSFRKHQGTNGQKTVTTQFTYGRSGQVTKQKVLGEKITLSPVDEILLKGKKDPSALTADAKEKAQEFYGNYQSGNPSDTSGWFNIVTARQVPYNTEGIKKAQSELSFRIAEITIGDPILDANQALISQENINDITIPFSVPLSGKSSSVFWKDQNFDFKVEAYFNPVTKEWFFPPVGPIAVSPASPEVNFDANSLDKSGKGQIKIAKIVHLIPLGYATPGSILLLLPFEGTLDGKDIVKVAAKDLKTDSGVVLAETSQATVLWSEVDTGQKLPISNIYTDTKVVSGSKKISMDITQVSNESENAGTTISITDVSLF